MIHNIVVVGNQAYKAVKERKAGSCDGCAIGFGSEECGLICWKGLCYSGDRDDGRTVIYKPHYKLKHK